MELWRERGVRDWLVHQLGLYDQNEQESHRRNPTFRDIYGITIIYLSYKSDKLIKLSIVR